MQFTISPLWTDDWWWRGRLVVAAVSAATAVTAMQLCSLIVSFALLFLHVVVVLVVLLSLARSLRVRVFDVSSDRSTFAYVIHPTYCFPAFLATTVCFSRHLGKVIKRGIVWKVNCWTPFGVTTSSINCTLLPCRLINNPHRWQCTDSCLLRLVNQYFSVRKQSIICCMVCLLGTCTLRDCTSFLYEMTSSFPQTH